MVIHYLLKRLGCLVDQLTGSSIHQSTHSFPEQPKDLSFYYCLEKMQYYVYFQSQWTSVRSILDGAKLVEEAMERDCSWLYFDGQWVSVSQFIAVLTAVADELFTQANHFMEERLVQAVSDGEPSNDKRARSESTRD